MKDTDKSVKPNRVMIALEDQSDSIWPRAHIAVGHQVAGLKCNSFFRLAYGWKISFMQCVFKPGVECNDRH